MKTTLVLAAMCVGLAARASAEPRKYGEDAASWSEAGRACGTAEELAQYLGARKTFVQVVHVHNDARMFYRDTNELAQGLVLVLTPSLPGFETLALAMTPKAGSAAPALGFGFSISAADPGTRFDDSYGATWSFKEIDAAGKAYYTVTTLRGSPVLGYGIETTIDEAGAVKRRVTAVTDQKRMDLLAGAASRYDHGFASFVRGRREASTLEKATSIGDLLKR